MDFGCGAGVDLAIAQDLSKGHAIGVDLSNEMIEIAKKYVGKSNCYIATENQPLPFENKYFDTIISNGAINLVPDKESLLKDFSRILKPGGSIHFADIILHRPLPQEMRNASSWAN